MKLTNFNQRNVMVTYWENAVYQAPDKEDGTKGAKHFYVDAMMDAKDVKEGEKQGSLHLASRKVLDEKGQPVLDEKGNPKRPNTVAYSESQINKILDVAKASNNVQRIDHGDGKTQIVALVKADVFASKSKAVSGVLINTKNGLGPSDYQLGDASKRLQEQFDYMKANAGAGKVAQAEAQKGNGGIPTASAAEIPTVANEKTGAKAKPAKTTKAKASTGKARASKAKTAEADGYVNIPDGVDEPLPFN